MTLYIDIFNIFIYIIYILIFLNIILYIIYYIYLLITIKLPSLSYDSSNEFNILLIKKCKTLKTRFIPCPIIIFSILQSFCFVFWSDFKNCLKPRFKFNCEELIHVVGGNDDNKSGQFYLKWHLFEKEQGKPGDHYLHRLSWNLHRHHPNWKFVTKSWRGFGCDLKGPLETWDEQAIEDLHIALKHIHTRYPLSPIYGAGFSFGGTLLALYLGKYPLSNGGYLSGAVAISSPHNLADVLKQLPGNYCFFNLRSANKSLIASHSFNYMSSLYPEHKKELLQLPYNVNKMLYPKYIYNIFTIPSVLQLPRGSVTTILFDIVDQLEDHGNDYSNRHNRIAYKYLPNIMQPLLCFQSHDDQVSPPFTYIKYKELCMNSNNPYTIWVETEKGGHCGWFHGFFGDSWIDKCILEFFDFLSTY